MLRLVRYEDDARTDDTRDVLPFPIGLARARGRSGEEPPIDGASADAAWQVERAMIDVELNFLKLKRLMEESAGPPPRAA